MSLPTKEGYLQKYRNKLSGWENRYFKLDRTYLHYYEAKDAPTPRKTVLRTDIISAQPSDSFPGRSNVLELVVKGTDKWYIQFEFEYQLKEWAKAFLAHIPSSDSTKRAWLDVQSPSAPPLEVPTMPQYMLQSAASQEPPSYRTATLEYKKTNL